MLPKQGDDSPSLGPHPHLQSTRYLNDIEAGAILSASSNADPDQVLGVLLQGHLPGHSRDPAGKRST